MLSKNRRVPIQSFPKSSRSALRTKSFNAKLAKNRISYNRAGVITPKSSGSAVERNKLKRIVMAFFENSPKFWKRSVENGKDIVIIAAAESAKRPSRELQQEIKNYGQLF